MRAILVLVLFLAACSNQPSAATSPTPSPSPSTTTAPPSPTPTVSSTPSPSPIALPTFVQLSAAPRNVVWALVAGTRLFRSSDRGDTWTERSIPPGLANTEGAFADDTRGLLLNTGSAATDCQTQTAQIARTVDGAATWQKLPATGIADAMCKRGLTMADQTHAFLAASKPGSNPVIYRTADAGTSWVASSPIPVPPNLAAQGSTSITLTGSPRAFGSVVLFDGGGGQQTKDVFRSTDGGVTFAYASTAPLFDEVVYITATRWLQISIPNASMETTDGGASWHPYPTDYSQAAPIGPEIVFGDAMVGYATVRGSIQRTVDGGAHWTAIKTPGTI